MDQPALIALCGVDLLAPRGGCVIAVQHAEIYRVVER